MVLLLVVAAVVSNPSMLEVVLDSCELVLCFVVLAVELDVAATVVVVLQAEIDEANGLFWHRKFHKSPVLDD